MSELALIPDFVSDLRINDNVSHVFTCLCLLQIVDVVVSGIEQKVAQIVSYLETGESEMSEEVRGKVLAAIGKARLLVSQKIQQFQGLCHKNMVSTLHDLMFILYL